MKDVYIVQDISSPLAPTLSLPLVALPHIITSSLALSLSADTMPRLSHSNPSVRKKTIAALYRLALVHPDTMRSAWPKIKNILMDEEEDPSVTAAVVNIVCELGWRRPKDFLELAPRLFNLLIEGGNNWMSIKIIKLFATLTPLEPRLIKKLLPPLTHLIRTTPAMSLLYECINGIIQGGIFDREIGGTDGDEIASLCVNKLRGMIVIEGDPNLKYVALLAFNRIVVSHPHLISMQQDVIMSCIDDLDISIRLQALYLGAGMVDSENIVPVVERLIQQLRNALFSSQTAHDAWSYAVRVEPAADSDDEDPEETLAPTKELLGDAPILPLEYRMTVIRQILQMCSSDTYSKIVDFDWYIKVLMQLIKLLPAQTQTSFATIENADANRPGKTALDGNVSGSIGWELRNVAVRVSTIRAEAVHAAHTLVSVFCAPDSSAALSIGGEGVLQYAAWILGEYAEHCVDPQSALDALLRSNAMSLPCDATCAYVQAVPKILARITSQQSLAWTREHKSMTSLLLTRIIDFLEPLSSHPNLEVQERAVEFLELMRIASQAIANEGQTVSEAPLLLTRAIPELFLGSELNPVASSAQRKVPISKGLNLAVPIHSALTDLLQSTEIEAYEDVHSAEFKSLYNQKPPSRSLMDPALNALPSYEQGTSYQQAGSSPFDTEESSRKRMLRRIRNNDDPFYIASDEVSSGTSTPFHDILRSSNGDIMDVDSIPIMSLDLENNTTAPMQANANMKQPKPRRPKRVHVVKDETIEQESVDQKPSQAAPVVSHHRLHRSQEKGKTSLLEVDSSGLGSFSVVSENSNGNKIGDPRKLETQDGEMAKALADVERLRLEMQRASERIQASDGTPAEGTLVKKRKKKAVKQPTSQARDSQTLAARLDEPSIDATQPLARKLKKKKKEKSIMDEANDGTFDEHQ